MGQPPQGWDRAGMGILGLGQELWGWDRTGTKISGLGQGLWGWAKDTEAGTGQGWGHGGCARDPRAGPVPQATEEQIKLLRLQRHLQEELDKPYLDLSLHDTVHTLILDGHHKRAEQLYRDFKIPDKRWGWAQGESGGLQGQP